MGRRSVAVTLLALAALTSGCDWLAAPSRPLATGDTGPRLDRATFARRVEAACDQRARALAALPRPSTQAERRAFFGRVADIVRIEYGALVALRPPKADEREFTRLVLASGRMTTTAARFRLAVVRHHAHARRRALADADRASEAFDRAARRLGLACRAP